MIVDITNEILTALKTSLTGVTVLSAYPSTTPIFPCVVIEEIANDTTIDTVDSYGENHSDVALRIDIFSNAPNKISVVKGIRATIDTVMSGTYRMNRSTSQPIPNYLDSNIYRYILRYDFRVDKNKKVYRR